MGANLMPASVPAASVTGGSIGGDEDQRAVMPGRFGSGEGEGGHLQQVEQGQLEAPSHREANEGFATEQQQYAQSEAGQGTMLSYR